MEILIKYKLKENFYGEYYIGYKGYKIDKFIKIKKFFNIPDYKMSLDTKYIGEKELYYTVCEEQKKIIKLFSTHEEVIKPFIKFIKQEIEKENSKDIFEQIDNLKKNKEIKINI